MVHDRAIVTVAKVLWTCVLQVLRKFRSDSVDVALLETAGIFTVEMIPYCGPMSHGNWRCLSCRVRWGPRSGGSALLVVGFSVPVSNNVLLISWLGMMTDEFLVPCLFKVMCVMFISLFSCPNFVTIFYRAKLCIARTMLSQDVRLSVRLFVTRRYCVETAKCVVTVFPNTIFGFSTVG